MIRDIAAWERCEESWVGHVYSQGDDPRLGWEDGTCIFCGAEPEVWQP